MKKRCLAALTALVMMLCLCACGAGGGEESSEPTTTKASRTTRRLIDLKIETLISREEIEDILGVPMRDVTVNREGTALYALSQEGALSVQISLSEQTEDQFVSMVNPEPSDGTAAPEEAADLGAQAWWLNEQRVLLAYKNGYALSVNVIYEDYSDDDALFVSRNLAATVLEKLPA